MILAAHQPNLCPYWPIFQKIAAADVFVILTHCQFEKGGYQNRFQHKGEWMTMPVRRGLEQICDKKYISPEIAWARIVARYSLLSQFDPCVHESLATMNTAIIWCACSILGIKTKIVTDYATDLRGTDRLVDLCKHFGANEYLSGPSGPDYLEMDKFGAIKVSVQQVKDEDKKSLIEVLE